jgi:hypothetical protein
MLNVKSGAVLLPTLLNAMTARVASPASRDDGGDDGAVVYFQGSR